MSKKSVVQNILPELGNTSKARYIDKGAVKRPLGYKSLEAYESEAIRRVGRQY